MLLWRRLQDILKKSWKTRKKFLLQSSKVTFQQNSRKTLHSSDNWISTINFNDDRSECTKNKINYEPCKHLISYALNINHHFYVLQFCVRHSFILVFIRQMLISWIELSWSYWPNYVIKNYSWGSQGESSRFRSTWRQLN